VFHFINGFLAQELKREREPCELEHCHGGESNRLVKVQALFYTQPQVTASVFPHSVDCLTLYYEFKVNSALEIEESDEHCFQL
jgi:hypothetical protein